MAIAAVERRCLHSTVCDMFDAALRMSKKDLDSGMALLYAVSGISVCE